MGEVYSKPELIDLYQQTGHGQGCENGSSATMGCFNGSFATGSPFANPCQNGYGVP